MIYRKKTVHSAIPGGFCRLDNERTRAFMSGFGFGEHIHLRDENGRVWRGRAERDADDVVHYSFRDENGHLLSGIGDRHRIVLRDRFGRIWRGILD